MANMIFDLFDFNNDGHVDVIEETMAYTVLFGIDEPQKKELDSFDNFHDEYDEEE